MNKKELPVVYPPLTTFAGFADALAILCSHEEALDWVYSHYVQFFATQTIIDNPNEDFYPTTGYATGFFNDFDNRKLANLISDCIFLDREKCPHLNIFEIPNSLIRSSGESYVSFIKRNIDLSMYTYGHADISKIKKYGLDKKSDLSFHPILIYGYNDFDQEFLFADFIDDKYSFSSCSYNEVEAAYQSINQFYLPLVKSISSIEYVSYPSFKFDYSYIQDTISEYLTPDRKKAEQYEKYSTSYFSPLKWHAKTFIGVDAYDFLSDFLDLQTELGIYPIDFKPYHALYDHKEMMIKRMEHFIKKGYISESKSGYIAEYSRISDNAKRIRNLLLKYNIKKLDSILDTVKKLLMETKQAEIPLLKAIFDI